MNYLDNLPKGTSLQVFDGDNFIFSSNGKWLHPLFELEDFLKNNNIENKKLCSHDSAIGKAAAVLSIRLGIKKINADIFSENAKKFIDDFNQKVEESDRVEVHYKNIIPKIMCATENQLEPLSDIDEMYFLLRKRANLVKGVSVKVSDISHKFIYKKNISFELNAGDHLMIVGENGAGKTTFLKILAGIIKRYDGQVFIEGKKIDKIDKYTIGYIPQTTESAKYDLSVEEVVSLGIKDKKNQKQIIKSSLERTSSYHLLKRSFSSLSGGEKQKIGLARCLAQEAKLLLLDEPTASLDEENRKMVFDILRSLTVSEIPTIIVVTHDKELTKLKGWELLQFYKDA